MTLKDIILTVLEDLDIVASSDLHEYNPISLENIQFTESNRGNISAYVDNGSVYLGFLTNGIFNPLSLEDETPALHIYKSQLGVIQGEQILDASYKIEGRLDSKDLSVFRRVGEPIVPYSEDVRKQA